MYIHLGRLSTSRSFFLGDKTDVLLVITKRALYVCMCSAVVDVQIIAKFARRIFACVARSSFACAAVLLCNQGRDPRKSRKRFSPEDPFIKI